jgi:N-dimethylarginine dimethylaminohydrolase
MITADTAHVFAMKARDGEDSIVSQFLSKLDAQIQERSRQGMFWLYVNYETDEFMHNASMAEVELVKMKLRQLGYAVVEYKLGAWEIAW